MDSIQELYGENNEWYLHAEKEHTFFYHLHPSRASNTKDFFIVTKEGACRQCGEVAPKGVRFMVKTAQLKLAR